MYNDFQTFTLDVVDSTFNVTCESGCHVFGLEGDKTLYSMCLVTLQQNVGSNKGIHPLTNLHHIHWNLLFPNLG
jgi:hypothetical protein